MCNRITDSEEKTLKDLNISIDCITKHHFLIFLITESLIMTSLHAAHSFHVRLTGEIQKPVFTTINQSLNYVINHQLNKLLILHISVLMKDKLHYLITAFFCHCQVNSKAYSIQEAEKIGQEQI